MVTENFYTLTMLVLKISLGLFFLRTLVKPWVKYVIYTAMCISSVFGVLYFFFTVFQCGFFDNILEFGLKRITGNKCASPRWEIGLGYTHAVIAVVTDITFALLPIAALQGTMMGKREKFTVIFILSLAAVYESPFEFGDKLTKV